MRRIRTLSLGAVLLAAGGAGCGAAVGAISAASGDDCLGYTDPGGAFVCVMRQDPDVGINVAFGALVDLLIK